VDDNQWGDRADEYIHLHIVRFSLSDIFDGVPLGGATNFVATSSCEALVVDGDALWEDLSPMHDARAYFACGAVAGCIIVAGGLGRKSAEVYDGELNRWLRLPRDLPYESSLAYMGSAVL
jgi:hypothetical protein